jgi:hypothetical protein
MADVGDWLAPCHPHPVTPLCRHSWPRRAGTASDYDTTPWGGEPDTYHGREYCSHRYGDSIAHTGADRHHADSCRTDATATNAQSTAPRGYYHSDGRTHTHAS